MNSLLKCTVNSLSRKRPESNYKPAVCGRVFRPKPLRASKEEIEKWATLYGITYADAMKYKSEWLTAIRNSEDRYAK